MRSKKINIVHHAIQLADFRCTLSEQMLDQIGYPLTADQLFDQHQPKTYRKMTQISTHLPSLVNFRTAFLQATFAKANYRFLVYSGEQHGIYYNNAAFDLLLPPRQAG